MTRTSLTLLTGAAFALSLAGCSTMNQTETGALAGGAIGAGAGTLIGAATGNPKTGAVVGGLLGAGAGGLIGNEADRKDAQVKQVRQAQAEQAYVDAQPNRIDEVIKLTQAGQDEAVIINHIRNNRMTFHLTADDLNLLSANKVSPRVITTMQESGQVRYVAPPRPIVVREEVVVREPVFVAPRPYYYGPPAGVFISGRFR